MVVGSQQRLEQITDVPLVVIGDHTIKIVPGKDSIVINEALKWQEHLDGQYKNE
jgi:hypothetical protein